MNFLKDLLRAFLIGTVIFLVLVIIQYIYGYVFSNAKEVAVMFLYNQIYSVILYFVNAYYFRFLLKGFAQDTFKIKNLLKGAVGGIALTILTLFLIRITTETLIEGASLASFFAKEQIQNYYVAFVISVVITAIFYAVYYYQNKQEIEVKEQKIIAGTAAAKFDALKNQLDPHFLFNSLNVLTSLIEENPSMASKFTTSLSKVYRYVLEQKNKQLVTLEEELKFAELYMSLLSMRFEDSIVYQAPVQLKNPNAKVVPLSLQLLLENAVKHNQVMPSRKLIISIVEKNGTLVVTNNLQRKEVLKESMGFGLRNIRDRYALLTTQPLRITETEKEFQVAIPIINENTEIVNPQESFISEKRYKMARKRVESIKVFYVHLFIYLLGIPIFIYLNYLSQTNFPWALFPIGGWGIGVASHAAEAFNYNPFFGKKWEERKIKEYMEKDF